MNKYLIKSSFMRKFMSTSIWRQTRNPLCFWNSLVSYMTLAAHWTREVPFEENWISLPCVRGTPSCPVAVQSAGDTSGQSSTLWQHRSSEARREWGFTKSFLLCVTDNPGSKFSFRFMAKNDSVEMVQSPLQTLKEILIYSAKFI